MAASRARSLLVALAFAAVLSGVVAGDAGAAARAKVVVAAVELPRNVDEPALAKWLTRVLEKEARHADFGPPRDEPVVVSVDVTELSVVASSDVVRVECALTGRLAGGGTAKSRMSMGGHPKDRERLEKQVLTMLGRGVVGRLAALSRARG